MSDPRTVRGTIESAAVSAGSFELVLRGGRMLRVPVGVEASWLAQVVVALEGVERC